MIKPVYIDYTIYEHLDKQLYNDLEVFYRADQYFWNGTRFIAHPRYGRSEYWDFSKDFSMIDNPSLLIKDPVSFSEASDRRAQEFVKSMSGTDKRLAIFWSGGIDSTVIVSAVIKNFPRHLLQQVDIYMNDYSFLESPAFYNKIIKGYDLNCISNENFDSSRLSSITANGIVTDGEPADKLWSVRIGLAYLYRYGESSFNSTLEQGQDQFIEFLGNFMSPQQAKLYWQYVTDNVKETGAPVTNISELFWWINFNYHWVGHVVGWYVRYQDKTADTWAKYKENYLPWYNTRDYQCWSFNRSHDDSFSSLAQYKMQAKQYIHDLTKDDSFLNYKTKVPSGRRGSSKENGFVVFDDGTAITDAKDLPGFVEKYCLVK